MQEIIQFYVSLFPVILAGVANSVFLKTKIFNSLARPIDGGKTFFDNERVFGDSKTYRGFAGYVVLGIVFTVLWGLVCSKNSYLQANNFFYENFENIIQFNLLVGLLLGFAWALFELPNSFFKRRLGVKPSQNAKGIKGVLLAILDQADSIFGVMLVVLLFHPLSISWYFIFVAIGAATHIVINFLLYAAKLRKRPI